MTRVCMCVCVVVRVLLQDYDPKKVSEVQALYRKTHLKKRLRSLGKLIFFSTWYS